MPFTDVPDTLQYFAEDDATLTVTFDPDATVMPTDFASVEPLVVLPAFTLGDVLPEPEVPDPPGTVVLELVGMDVVDGLVVDELELEVLEGELVVVAAARETVTE